MRDPHGRCVTLRRGDLEAVIATVGAALRTLRHDDVDLVAGDLPGTMCTDYRGWVLAPWPNRVAEGRYAFAGDDHQLPVDEVAHGNALHGLVGWVTWEIQEQTEWSVRLRHELVPRPGYPFPLDLTADYSLTDAGLSVRLRAVNAGDRRAPYGVGHHPYLTVGRGLDDCELRLAAGTVLPLDEHGRPTEARPVRGTAYDFRTPRRLAGVRLDHPFTGLESESVATLRDPDSGREVRIVLGGGFDWVHVFTGDNHGARARESLAVEPMSCPPDALRSGRDLKVLEPGQEHVASFVIEAGRAG